MKRWCEEYGRPYESILRTHFTMPLVLAPTRAALETKLAGMPQDTLTWAADALFAGTPEEAITFYRGLPSVGSSTSSPTPWAVTKRRSSCSARR